MAAANTAASATGWPSSKSLTFWPQCCVWLRLVDLAAVDPRDEPVHVESGVQIPGNGATVRASRAG
jgi:hypothetical protein